MPNALTTPANKSAKQLPPLTADAKAAIRWMRQRAGEAASFAGIEDTAGKAIERLATMEWGSEASDLFDDNEKLLLEDADGPDELDIAELNKGLPADEQWQVHEPGIAMSLARNGKRPTRANVAEMVRHANPKIQRLGLYLQGRPELTEEGRPLTPAEQADVEALIDRGFGKRA